MQSILIFISLLAGLNPYNDDWFTDESNKYFTIDLPNGYKQATGLNDHASMQYEFVVNNGKTVQECYLIILEETKEEIESYDLDFEFDPLSYYTAAMDALKSGIDKSKDISVPTRVLQKNDMRFAEGKVYGKLGHVKVIYHLGIYESNRAFYQVLTWTIKNQYEIFGDEMQKIIYSFKEK